MLDFIVSVCHPKHLPAWREAQARIPTFIASRDHLLVVPDDSLADFAAVTDKRIRVEPESLHVTSYADRLRDSLLKIGEERRYGSYVQQMIKLGAIRGRPAGERLLIWDADTVPMRELKFFGDGGSGRFYSEHRAHEPMFVQVERALGMQKATKRSFIAQCFPIKSEWANAFFEELEQHGDNWYERILSSIPFERGSALSEYELLGTFIAHRFGTEIEWSQDVWLRNGYRFARSEAGGIDLSDIPSEVHFVALEDYDRPNVNVGCESVDPTFEPVAVRNRRISGGLSQSCLRLLEAAKPDQQEYRVLFVGLDSEAEVLLPVDWLREHGVAVTIVSVANVQDQADVPWSRVIHGIPAAESGEQEIYVLETSRARRPESRARPLNHLSGGHLVSPRLTNLACRFWTETVDWDDVDSVRFCDLEAVQRVTVPAISWSQILGQNFRAVIVAQPGFEREVLDSLITHLKMRMAPSPSWIGFTSTYRDAALCAGLEELGFTPAIATAAPGSDAPIFWAFERGRSASTDSD